MLVWAGMVLYQCISVDKIVAAESAWHAVPASRRSMPAQVSSVVASMLAQTGLKRSSKAQTQLSEHPRTGWTHC